MRRRAFVGGCACCGLLAAVGRAARAADDGWQPPPRFLRPEMSTDEGGLWAMLDREEAKLKRSKFLIRDKELNDYIRDIAIRLAGEHGQDIRLYIVRTPLFNANMAPNGMMQVWTGLLLRMANEAQLAAVLGHEIGHYLARHSLDQLRDAKSRSAFGQFLGIALTAAGAGGFASLSNLMLTAGMFAYTRDHEREADRIGLDLMVRAGYEPMEASRVWDQLLSELKAESDWTGVPAQRSVLFASHPREDERRDDLAARAAAISASAHNIGLDAWRHALSPYRRTMLEDELLRRRSGETLALLDRMIAAAPDDGELQYFRGETFRLRGGEGDVERALDAYRLAEERQNSPPELYRSRGLLMRTRGDESAAKEAFRRYLALRPGAEDGELIASYVN